jgi:hypothetical protein
MNFVTQSNFVADFPATKPSSTNITIVVARIFLNFRLVRMMAPAIAVQRLCTSTRSDGEADGVIELWVRYCVDFLIPNPIPVSGS